MVFSDEEVAYLRSRRLARIAAVSADGQPDVVPAGYEFDRTHLYVGGPAACIRIRPAISWSWNPEGRAFTHDREVVVQRTVHETQGL